MQIFEKDIKVAEPVYLKDLHRKDHGRSIEVSTEYLDF